MNDKIKLDYAQIGGIRLHYATAGSGDKLVLLLHGFPEFWYSWRHQLLDLSDEYTMVAPDLRGYNLSDKPLNVSDYRLEYLVDDVIGLIHHFGREKAAVIGHDWGASIAWAAAAKHPEALWKLGALQVPPISVWRANQTFRQLLASWYMFFFQIPKLPEFLLKRDDFALLENGLKNMTAHRKMFSADELAEYKKAWSQPFALTAMLHYYRANILQRMFGKTEAPEITVPTVFIYGEMDTAILPETVKGIKRVMSAPFEEFHIPNAGHWIQQEESEAVTQILRDFLAE